MKRLELESFEDSLDFAYTLAEMLHHNQKYGDKPYMYHIQDVYTILQIVVKKLGWGELTSIDKELDIVFISAILHDTVEDTSLSIDGIREIFGNEIADVVWAVTNEKTDPSEYDSQVSQLTLSTAYLWIEENIKKPDRIKTYRKIKNNKLATIVKLADRVSNVKNCILMNAEYKYNKYKERHEEFSTSVYKEDYSAMPRSIVHKVHPLDKIIFLLQDYLDFMIDDSKFIHPDIRTVELLEV